LTDHLFSPGPSFPKLSCKDDDFGGKTSSPLALLLPLLLLLKQQLSKPLPLIREERSAPPTENDAHTDEAKPLVPKTVVLFSIFAPENARDFWRKNSKNDDRICAHIDSVSYGCVSHPTRERVEEREILRRRAL
jgi:hypothetical protein